MKRSVKTEVWRKAQTGHLETWITYARKGAAGSPERRAVWEAILDAVRRAAPLAPGERILDIGCGLDTVLDFIDDARGYTLDSLAGKLEPLGLSRAARHLAGVFERMPFQDGAFDRVFLMNVLDHVQNPMAGLEEIARVLAANGVLVLSVDTYAGRKYIEKRLHKWWTRVRGTRTKHPWAFSVPRVEAMLGQAGFGPAPSCHVPGTKKRRTLFVARRCG
jgi:SAM-dependent methyltransferase